MNVKQRIQILAKEKGLSIVALERECGLKRGVVEKWGASSPSVANVKKVADYFGTTIDCLCFGTQNSEQELSPSEQSVLNLFRQLNTDGHEAAIKYMEFLLTDKKYNLSGQYNSLSREVV